jgi:hypothetical protein
MSIHDDGGDGFFLSFFLFLFDKSFTRRSFFVVVVVVLSIVTSQQDPLTDKFLSQIHPLFVKTDPLFSHNDDAFVLSRLGTWHRARIRAESVRVVPCTGSRK